MDVEEDGPSNAPEGARWARDADSDVVWCETAEGLLQAVADGHSAVEVGGAEPGPLMEAVVRAASSLQQLSLTGCNLTAEALGQLAAALGPTTIKGVGISNNPGVDSQAWAALWAAMPATVTKWDVGDNGLSDVCLPALASAVSKGRPTELFLDGNDFSDISPLLPLVKGSLTLGEVDLGDNSLGDAQLQALAEALPGSTVETLVLGRNPGITDAGATALVYSLPRTKVATLHLDSTQIGDATLSAMVDVLADTQLVELHIDETKITDAGVMYLCKALPKSKIKFLDAGDNNLSEETARAVEGIVGADMSVA